MRRRKREGGKRVTQAWAMIIVGALSMIGTLAGSFIAGRKATTLIAYRIEQLEQRVSKHNSLVERMYKLEEESSVIQEQIKVANHRLTDLERKDEEK